MEISYILVGVRQGRQSRLEKQETVGILIEED